MSSSIHMLHMDCISLSKGMDTTDGTIRLISEVITSLLHIDISVLMGANIALDVVKGDFCESTIGCRSSEQGEVLKSLLNRPTFRINVVKDIAAVELCGALKVGRFCWLNVRMPYIRGVFYLLAEYCGSCSWFL